MRSACALFRRTADASFCLLQRHRYPFGTRHVACKEERGTTYGEAARLQTSHGAFLGRSASVRASDLCENANPAVLYFKSGHSRSSRGNHHQSRHLANFDFESGRKVERSCQNTTASWNVSGPTLWGSSEAIISTCPLPRPSTCPMQHLARFLRPPAPASQAAPPPPAPIPLPLCERGRRDRSRRLLTERQVELHCSLSYSLCRLLRTNC